MELAKLMGNGDLVIKSDERLLALPEFDSSPEAVDAGET